jgi:hypothetical protein
MAGGSAAAGSDEPVINTNGVPCWRDARMAPSTPGRPMPLSTTSTGSRPSRSSAASANSAMRTSNPAVTGAAQSGIRTIGASSTTSTRALRTPSWMETSVA